MTNNSIQKIQFRAHGAIIDSLWDELHKEGFQTKRSPIYLSAWAKEYIDVFVSLSTPFAVLATILVARIGKNKRVRVTFSETGQVKEIEAPPRKK